MWRFSDINMATVVENIEKYWQKVLNSFLRKIQKLVVLDLII